jgi:hypothetical protein
MNTPSRRRAGTRWKVLAAWVAGALVSLSSCTQAESPTGGETHFLKRCSGSESCGEGLSCVCGVCTRPCAEALECDGLPLAECVTNVDPAVCPAARAQCDVVCNDDSECSALSDAHRCEANVCRRGEGAGGSSGQGGTGGTGSCATGEVEANQVLVIGDSFFAISHQITAYLEEYARAVGALGAGERYRDNSATINNALAMGGNGITAQYTRGVEEADVRVVIMNGGGPDMLLSSCPAPVSECPALVAAADAAQALLDQMATDGVAHVVYAFYPDPTDPAMLERMDALRDLIEPICAASAVPCHWVDLRESLVGGAAHLSADGLIPTAAGSEVSATAIWGVMQRECVAQ